ncbi:hypothetical protein B0T19DRAFT_418786 [Cercophora scortea]|uniref:Secreted protein n=1 Tax=Cercophora scortea TaxID=314031 RepID=A0AAE0IYP5_9PEZI|nr:hypothetical protein B0T19DRAFT_418786 [Cercophora scortea]
MMEWQVSFFFFFLVLFWLLGKEDTVQWKMVWFSSWVGYQSHVGSMRACALRTTLDQRFARSRKAPWVGETQRRDMLLLLPRVFPSFHPGERGWWSWWRKKKKTGSSAQQAFARACEKAMDPLHAVGSFSVLPTARLSRNSVWVWSALRKPGLLRIHLHVKNGLRGREHVKGYRYTAEA